MLYCNIVKRTQEEILHGRCFTGVQHDFLIQQVDPLSFLMSFRRSIATVAFIRARKKTIEYSIIVGWFALHIERSLTTG